MVDKMCYMHDIVYIVENIHNVSQLVLITSKDIFKVLTEINILKCAWSTKYEFKLKKRKKIRRYLLIVLCDGFPMNVYPRDFWIWEVFKCLEENNKPGGGLMYKNEDCQGNLAFFTHIMWHLFKINLGLKINTIFHRFFEKK